MFTTLLLMSAIASTDTAPILDAKTCCPIVELRQYTVHPGMRDPFIVMFEREFVETQEATGLRVIGEFRDLDDPNHFVWLRGFPDMPSRAKSLQDFYGGPIWKAHRDEANAHFTDTDNVLLLHATNAASEFDLEHAKRAAVGATDNPRGLLIATIYYFDQPVSNEFVHFFEDKMIPALKKNDVTPIAYFASETTPNNFPRLPIRENDHVFVWFAMYSDIPTYEKQSEKLNHSVVWKDTIENPLRQQLNKSPQILRLTPAPRSLLHD
jgi:hypothetical protein